MSTRAASISNSSLCHNCRTRQLPIETGINGFLNTVPNHTQEETVRLVEGMQDIPSIEVLVHQPTKRKYKRKGRSLTLTEDEKPAKGPNKGKGREHLVSKAGESDTREPDELSLSEVDIQRALLGPCEKCIGREAPCTTDNLGPRHTTCNYCKSQKHKCSISNIRSAYFRTAQGKTWLKRKSPSHGVKRKAVEKLEEPSSKRHEIAESHTASPTKALGTIGITASPRTAAAAKPRTARETLGATETGKRVGFDVKLDSKSRRRSPSVEVDPEREQAASSNVNDKITSDEVELFQKHTTAEWREYQALTTDAARFEYLGFFMTRREAEYQNLVEEFARFKRETEGKVTIKTTVDQKHQVVMEEVRRLGVEIKEELEIVREDITAISQRLDEAEIGAGKLEVFNYKDAVQKLKDRVVGIEKQLKGKNLTGVSSTVAYVSSSTAPRVLLAADRVAPIVTSSSVPHSSSTSVVSATIISAANVITAADESIDSRVEKPFEIPAETDKNPPVQLPNPSTEHLVGTNNGVTAEQPATADTFVSPAVLPPSLPINTAVAPPPVNHSSDSPHQMPLQAMFTRTLKLLWAL